MKLTSILAGAALAAGIVAGPSASASTVVFDFESISSGVYPDVTQTVGGLTATFAPGPGGALFVYAPGPGHGIDGNGLVGFVPFGDGSPITANFSEAVGNISLTGGPYATPSSPNTSHVYLAAWSGINATGSLLGSVSGPLCCGFDYGASTVSLHVLGVRSVRFFATAFAYSSYMIFDNLTVETAGVPEPRAWAMLLLGFGGIGAVLRRKRLGRVRA